MIQKGACYGSNLDNVCRNSFTWRGVSLSGDRLQSKKFRLKKERKAQKGANDETEKIMLSLDCA